MNLTPRCIQLASPSATEYGRESIIKMDAGYVYHTIELVTNLKKYATITRITLDIGGTPITYDRAAIRDMLDKAYKRFRKEGRIVIPLSKFEMRSPAGIYQTALATGAGDDITLKVEFGAKDAEDPAVPTLRACAYVSENPAAALPGGGRKFLPMRYEHVQAPAAAGDHNWTFPNGSPNKWLQRLILDESEVQVTELHIKNGTKTVEKYYRDDIEFALQRQADGVLQPGFLIIDFVRLGFGKNDAINTHGLGFTFVVSGKGALKTYVDGFEQIAA
ncbi:major capsid protein P2 [Bowmanella denitrificans]|uniref:major capsid protein P2 n=1 Tax=Bowmanella denitrificans TaxID=366582 RepID=UPI000C9C2745|nr:major capsid protein P2 [Bowmanella denitrificans]